MISIQLPVALPLNPKNARCLFLLLSVIYGLHLPQAVASNEAVLTGVLSGGTRVVHETKEGTENQYRLSWEPNLKISAAQSMHLFAATGDEFSSLNNTFGERVDVNIRRFFYRAENGEGKVEIGVIPPFKGRVSSTGLSGDGWIKGARGVLQLPNAELEMVVGELDDLAANRAFALPDELNYFEVEYSAQINASWQFEVAADRMLEATFLRGEMRHTSQTGTVLATELITNFDSQQGKIVVSAEKSVSINQREMDLLIFYSYADQDFGARAELNEDFVDFGHALALEVSSPVNRWLRWIGAVEVYQGRSLWKLELRASHEH